MTLSEYLSIPDFLFSEGLTGQPLSVVAPNSTRILSGQDFTIELSAYVQPNPIGCAIFSNRLNAGSAVGLLIGLSPEGKPFVRATSSGMLIVAIDSNTPVTLNALHAFALTRIGGVWRLFVDGQQILDLRHNSNWAGAVDYGPSIYIGCDPYTAPFLGGIGQVRMTLGVGRYAGNYGISYVVFPPYPAISSIAFSALTSTVSQATRAFSTALDITHATNATVSVVDGSGNPVGSGWTITASTINNPTHWTISGTAPISISGYTINVSASVTIDGSDLTGGASYSVMNTADGILSAEQAIVMQSNSLALWIDGSDSTTVTSDSGNIIEVLDKANSVIFTNAPADAIPQQDTTSFSLNSISFGDGVSSGLVSVLPVPISKAAGNSTVFLVGKYNGVQVGQGRGLFQLAYAKDNTLEDGTATFALSTTTVGTDAANVLAYDNRLIQDGVSTAPILSAGSKFLVVWKSSTGSVQVYVNQQLISTSTLAGSSSLWAVLQSSIGFIGGSQSPTGAFISLAEALAFSSALNASDMANIESYLNHKWNLFNIRPFAQTPSVLSGYVGSTYAATTMISDATSVAISATGGSGWSIALETSTSYVGYRLSGTVPGDSGEVTSIVSTLNAMVTGVSWDIVPTTFGSISEYSVSGVIGSLSGITTLLSYLLEMYISSSTWTISVVGTGPGAAYTVTGAVAPITTLRTLTNNLLLSSIPDGDWSESSSPFGASTPTSYSYAINSQNVSDIFALINALLAKISPDSTWTITPTSPYAQIPYTISGTLPNTVGTVTLTISSTDSGSGVTTNDAFLINVLQLPNSPVINSPLNLECQIGLRYISAITISNATSVTVSSTGGSGWAIAAAPTGADGNYLITGTMPNAIGTILLTITATKTIPGGSPEVVTGIFTILATAAGTALILPYPLDLTGMLSSNLIISEQQTLTPYNGPKNQLLVPMLSPFYGSSLVVQYYDISGVLVSAIENVYYELAFQYEAFTNISQTPVYGGISFMNLGIVGTVYLSYQTVGGNFALNKKQLIEQLFISSADPNYLTWNGIVSKPTFFPVAVHELNMQKDSVGWVDLVTATTALAEATVGSLTDTDVGTLGTHSLVVTGNPHAVTKTQIGLGNVSNYPIATNVQAVNVSNSTTYLTPATAYLSANANLATATDTVHGKAMLNLGTLAGDDANSTKALTAQGLINLLGSGSSNAINSLLASLGIVSQVQAVVSPNPPVFPLWWKGVRYANLASFIIGVETFVGISPLPYDSTTSTFYFPVGVTIPSLVTSTTNNMASPIGMTVKGAVNNALLLST